MLSDRLKFVADAAYVPLVSAVGVDDHNATASYFPKSASRGYGTMMEAFFGYDVTPHWNVGVGGRYWAWNMHQATDESITKTLGQGVPTPEYDAFNASGTASSSNQAITGATRRGRPAAATMYLPS